MAQNELSQQDRDWLFERSVNAFDDDEEERERWLGEATGLLAGVLAILDQSPERYTDDQIDEATELIARWIGSGEKKAVMTAWMYHRKGMLDG